MFQEVIKSNVEFKIRSEIVSINVTNLPFILTVLKQINAVVIVTISMIHM